MTQILRSKAQLIEFRKKNKKVIVMFSAKNCEACALMRPIFDHIAYNYSSKVKLCLVYSDEVESLHKLFPTFEAFHNGQKVFQPVVYDTVKFKKLATDLINLSN